MIVPEDNQKEPDTKDEPEAKEPAVEPSSEPEESPAVKEEVLEDKPEEQPLPEAKAEEPVTDQPQESKDVPTTDPEPKPAPEEPGEPEAPKEKPKPEPLAEKPPKKKGKDKKDDKKGESDTDEELDEDFKYIVRIVNTDLNGHKTLEWGLTGIPGIGFRLASIIADNAGIPRDKKMGTLTDEEVDKLEELVKNVSKELPSWLINRQKDLASGDNVHIYGPEIQLTWRDDINRLKMIRCYRGIRHEQGQKVRGQRTRANGRSGTTVGVVKKAVRQKQSGGDKKK